MELIQRLKMYILALLENFIKNNTAMIRNLLLAMLLYSCQNAPSSPTVRSPAKFYSDINLFTLEGKNELRGFQYPCFSIDSIDNNKRMLKWFFSKQWNSSELFVYNGDHWLSSRTSSGDTSNVTRVINLYKDRVEQLTYLDDSSKLSYLDIFQNNVRTRMNLVMPIKAPFGHLDSNMLLQLMIAVLTDSFQIKNGVLKVNSKSVVFEEKITQNTTECYPIGNRSLFWWLTFEKFIDQNDKKCK
jgi:hypothetical protein